MVGPRWNYSPAWVVIHPQGDVVYFSPRPGRYPEPAPGAPSTRLVDMARAGIQLDGRLRMPGRDRGHGGRPHAGGAQELGTLKLIYR